MPTSSSRHHRMPVRPHRVLGAAVVLIGIACHGQRESATDTTEGRLDTSSAALPAWGGEYSLRGTIEQSRQATGSLTVEPLVPSASLHDPTRERVRRTYPDYVGPLFAARLSIVTGSDTTRGELTCAHGPSTPPPLVCQPLAPLREFENATLVVRPDGRAVLTGSHGEGVTIEYARFTWESRAGR